MAAADLVAWLVEATLAGSTALLAVLALRGRLRAWFGAGTAYAAWVAIPAALFATFLPALPSPLPVVPVLVSQAPFVLLSEAVPRQSAADVAMWICMAWAGGCALFATHLVVQQRRFVRGLGRLQDQGDGLLLADAVAGLPAAIGAWKPRIVMPADAMTRYDGHERALMLAHEREHVVHGDLLANAALALLRSVFWFNPLLHLAAPRFRDDQELACDQRVIAAYPQARRAYGEAMLKTQVAAGMLPLGCQWGQSHPLKERIEMLKQPQPSALRRTGGRAMVIAILLAAGYTAWAAQPGPAGAASPATGSDVAPQASIDNASRVSNPPVYPVDAQKAGVTGMVVLVVDVSIDGSVSATKVDRSAGDPRLDAAALDAVKHWKFTPAIKDGKPVASQVMVPVDFRIDDKPEAPVKTAHGANASGRPHATAWNSYEQLVGSLNASWQQPSTPADDC